MAAIAALPILLRLVLLSRHPVPLPDIYDEFAHLFTADTLRVLGAQGWTPRQLHFIVGGDAFAEVGSWHDFPALLELAHFVVIDRPGARAREAVQRLPTIAPLFDMSPALASEKSSTRARTLALPISSRLTSAGWPVPTS